MTTISREAVEAALRESIDPHLQQDPLQAGCLRELQVQEGQVQLQLVLPYPAGQFGPGWARLLQERLERLPGVRQARVEVSWQVAAYPVPAQITALQGVRNVIAVASGKGGVGKSTTAVNLALAMAMEGAMVGLLDADIYGPSLGLLCGVPEGTRPEVVGQMLQPVQAHGLQLMSMAFLTDEQTPMVWRGPMASGALLQLITQTAWQDLDYLIVDMPPGTGDIQLTLAQKVPVAGSLIVTTPQDLALLDARKGIEMFARVNIPVLGVVENMAVHVCSNCGQVEHLFGEGGGGKLAAFYGVEVLAALPLAMSIRQQSDAGVPVVQADPGGPVSALYRQLALNVGGRLARLQGQAPAVPSIEISEE